jgi:hypothetical protein
VDGLEASAVTPFHRRNCTVHTDTLPAPPPTPPIDDIVTRTVLVTPDMAREWLTKDVVNRPLIPRNVDALAFDMKSGRWVLTHQSIAFNRDGFLVDGQHRLRAVVAADVAVPMRVTYYVAFGYEAPIDTGCMRRAHHVLGIPSRAVAVCNAMVLLETGSVARSTAGHVSETLARHGRGIDWALDTFPQQRRLTSNVLAAHAFAYPTASDLVDDFARKLVTGVNIEPESPVLVLRRHLDRIEAFTYKVRSELGLATLRCLQAHCDGEPLGKVVTTDLGLAFFARRRAEMGLS